MQPFESCRAFWLYGTIVTSLFSQVILQKDNFFLNAARQHSTPQPENTPQPPARREIGQIKNPGLVSLSSHPSSHMLVGDRVPSTRFCIRYLRSNVVVSKDMRVQSTLPPLHIKILLAGSLLPLNGHSSVLSDSR